MFDFDLKQFMQRFDDSINLPVRYVFARMPGDKAPVRFWLPPRPGRYERWRVKQLRDLGFSVRIWSPMPEPNF